MAYNISIVIIGTNKYRKFLPDLINDCLLKFIPKHNLEIFVFSDKIIEKSLYEKNETTDRFVTQIHLNHEEWPGITMKRFNLIKKLPQKDYYYYIDADSRICDEISEEILSDRVAVLHYALQGRGTPEEFNRHSTAYISRDVKFEYIHAAFQGGKLFKDDCKILDKMLDSDRRRNIIPLWHDESYWNKYLTLYPATLHLPRGYVSDEENINRKIAIIPKVNEEIRSTE